MATLFHNETSDSHVKANRLEDRIIEFKIIDENAPKHARGLADPRLVTGGNRLHAQRDGNFLWYVRYEAGAVPPPLQQRWTHFPRLLEDVTQYYTARNMSIKRIEE